MLGAVAPTCDPNTVGGQGVRIPGGQEFETSVGKVVRVCLHKKINEVKGLKSQECR